MATLDEIRLQQLLAPFQNQNTGITNTTAATNMYTPFTTNQEMVSKDLVDQIIKENLIKTNLSNIGTTNIADTAPFFFPPNNQIVSLKKPTRGIVDSTIASNLLYDDLPPLRGIDTSYGVANEPDVEQVESLVSDEPKGIAKLFEFISNFTPFGLVRRGLESLRGLNDRIQGSDFGQATSLMDYLDMRKYGGLQGRNDAAARNMAQARGITKSLASRPSSTSGGYQQGPGGSGKQSTSASRTQQQAGPGFSGSGSADEMGSF
jgi:hypothetical protein